MPKNKKCYYIIHEDEYFICIYLKNLQINTKQIPIITYQKTIMRFILANNRYVEFSETSIQYILSSLAIEVELINKYTWGYNVVLFYVFYTYY